MTAGPCALTHQGSGREFRAMQRDELTHRQWPLSGDSLDNIVHAGEKTILIILRDGT